MPEKQKLPVSNDIPFETKNDTTIKKTKERTSKASDINFDYNALKNRKG